MRKIILFAAALLASSAGAEESARPVPSPGEIAAAAPKADWTAIAPADLLVMDLAPDSKGRARRVVIQLLPAPFSQGWIGNIRKLAAAQWWDGLSVNRVQDNYVVQWGDASEKKPLPIATSDAEYLDALVANYMRDNPKASKTSLRQLRTKASMQLALSRSVHGSSWNATGLQVMLESEYEISRKITRPMDDQGQIEEDPVPWLLGLRPEANGQSAFTHNGWAVGWDEDAIWPIHCYGMVGVGRDMSPNTGSGAELYTVIGHAPRHLDRNIALVGRVIEGIEHLSSLPRGTGALGFYETPEERTTISVIRIGTAVASLPAYEFLSTESASFAAYADARANRRDPFFIRPAGGADICNIPVPVRRVK